jgi:catechol 2,3-dioxygenase-like lactoylglutathione lyase family enzyme
MTIVLDHTIVFAADKGRSAELLAALLGLEVGAPAGPFAPVRVNDDLTLDFDDRFGARPGHYAFRVDEPTIVRALEVARDLGLDVGSDPGVVDGRRNADGRVYVRDPDGIAWELIPSRPAG